MSLGARAGTGESLDKYTASCAKEEDSSEDFKSYNYLSLCICKKLKLGFADPTTMGPEEGLSYFNEDRSKLN